MAMTRSEKAARMLQEWRERGCQLWPLCSCHETLAKWGNDLSDEDRVWPADLLEWAETSIYITLSCVSAYCPDPAMRAYALEQLAKGFWNKQRAMDMHVEQ